MILASKPVFKVLWDDIPLRFPMAHQEGFEHARQKHKVNIDEIRAISRRERVLSLAATSGVGARGLMQIMPATAKATAKKHGAKYSDPKDLYSAELNLNLWQCLLCPVVKKSLTRTVSSRQPPHNAGPSRVRRWLANSDGKLDAMGFIEAIPFTETREYVQAVFSYRLIYEAQEQKSAAIIQRSRTEVCLLTRDMKRNSMLSSIEFLLFSIP